MKKIVFYFVFSIFIFLFFNVDNVNSNDQYALTYSNKDIYIQKVYNIKFYDLNIYDVEKIFKNLDIKIISIKPKETSFFKETIAYSNVSNVMDKYTKYLNENNHDEESIYFKLKGFYIENMTIICTIDELKKLESMTNII